ncbi:ATP-dependent helicase [Desulfobulbus oligotrophicus]|jgi:DNA helicase-2/ATP-dependent DNA helicase PcrA|uniref:DNA 3'-5' helicase n=1 Tax=Desulfobulbus oligotrophicus TaxID=1909699 RepID=A0A7T5VET0_9BACT|nr:ATP-dependent helicase [Desulfobulbus oligotrophicus]MDY0390599.1 ATP-dependent helicase [Desulfobulbus oligotrophicus]QQG66466.1 ATP-dependent helicase [Desulfobulbus oligotrophicus]
MRVQSSFPENQSAESITEPAPLNLAQQIAVSHGDGPILVIAGAGSGKTRTLVYRMAHLIERGVEPESVLLLTFTRRAAQEMLQRAGELTAGSCRRVMGGTFHATANILLRRYGHLLNLGPNFTIIDRGDAEGIINLLKSSLGMGGAGKRFPSKRVVMNLISGAVNKSSSIEQLVYEDHLHLTEFLNDFYTIADHYRQFKRDHGLLDYDDLLVYWKQLLVESENARVELSSRFQHILVDEYQDTNLLQAEIVRLLAYCHQNVMVVGDDAQSIYSFRGADFANIMRFPEQFPGTRIVKLEENYRSTEPILQLTNAIIANAEKKFTKTLFTEKVGGVRPQLAAAPNEAAEARFIVQEIQKHHQNGTPLTDIAVLFRSGFHSFKLEIELAAHGFDFEKRGGLRLTESAHIKDVLSFLRVIINPWDNLSWNRILLQLEKVGPKTVQKILNSVRQADNPLTALTAYRPAPTWRLQFEKLVDMLGRLHQPDLTPSDQYDLVMEYYSPIFEKIYYDDYPKRRRELEQIKALISGYGDLQSFIDDTALDPPEVGADAEGIRSEQRLTLSTIHSAKGLEWDTVFVMGLAEGRFPHQHATPGEQWEEERRLLYVATTRAKKELFLTYPKEMLGSDRQLLRASLTPFLREVSPGLYTNIDQVSARTPLQTGQYQQTTSQLRHPNVQSARITYQEGMRVTHAFFGHGRVVSIPGPRRIEILFDRHGSKILHLDYAKLEILD